MIEDTADPHPNNIEFKGEVKGAQIGNHNIIYNYFYYRQEVKPASVDVADDNLLCPYRGLFHFGPDDADVFFGREIFIEELYSATKTKHFIPVLGASGSGKSSVVLAGLVPKLYKEGHWQFTHFRPGLDPFHALSLALVPLYTPNLDQTDQIRQARKLADYLQNESILLSDVFAQIRQNHPNDRVLLIADQFEEIYTLCNDEKIRRKFLDSLLNSLENTTSLSSSATVLVTTMRADFLGNALSYRPFADVLQNADVKLGPMNRKELTEVIKKPAQKLGVTFEPGLVERILNDVENQPGNLPLLEFALTELWNKRTGKQLTHKVYEEIGQVEGALARHADEKYGNLTDDEKEKVRRIFIQLVRPGEGTEDTRRVAIRKELGEQSWSLVKQLADARLVVTSRNTNQETVEVVHEALIRNWGELREWMNTNRVFRVWQERVRAAKAQWEKTKRDPGSLLRGAALAEAEEELNKRPEDLIDEKNFIEQSLEFRDREIKIQKRRQMLTISGLSIGLIAVSLFAIAAVWQRQMAQNALEEQIIASAESSEAFRNSKKELYALLLAVRAGQPIVSNQLKVGVKTQELVLESLQKTVGRTRELNRLEGHKNAIRGISFSPEGDTIGTASDDSTAKLWSVNGRELKTLEGHKQRVLSISFSPDGQTIATGSEDQTVKLWNRDGKLLQTLNGHKGRVFSVTFSPDSNLIASASGDNKVKLWKRDGNLHQTISGHKDWINSVSFSPDGQTIATASNDKTVRLWSSSNGNEIRRFTDIKTQEKTAHNDTVTSVSFSPDGKTIATSSADRTVKLWSLQDGHLIQTLEGHSDIIHQVSFSPDGKTIATVSNDQTVKLWDKSGNILQTFASHNGAVFDVSFSPKGKIIVTGSADRTSRLWSYNRQELQPLIGHKAPVWGVAFSPDGQTIASASADKTVKLWSRDGRPMQTLTGHKDIVSSVTFSPDGQTIASASADKTVKLWSLNGQERRSFTGHQGKIRRVNYSPNGQMIVTASEDNTAKIWSLDGRPIRTLKHSELVYFAGFSPDGQTIATASRDKTVILWNLDGTKKTTLKHNDFVYFVSFSHDGKIIATSSADGTITFWSQDGKKLKTLTAHDVQVYTVSFSPNGKFIATTSRDKTVKLWSISKDNKEIQIEELKTFTGHTGIVDYSSFSSDGQTIATASRDKTVILWTLDINELEKLTNSKKSLNTLMKDGCDWIKNYLNSSKSKDSKTTLCHFRT
ncbi:WD40 repeat domain-containing protein [Sphaerospermopsis sp. LEGE 08334]|uniref:WD40 repeat domain-containing protein n=1 Tax=Sphaerospermopsis sp. LEGE 08334 TaxID=1828651 RepID=UPI0018827597|nr:WD40 repeat domain-containing protein [Sphaerospermopsis sp. LEGE 08334]MBE9059078.1 WD40 repeat domain-containing protein [Sphaerospermopsis sp. LEGE 08334]